jgi:hypothetical protein
MDFKAALKAMLPGIDFLLRTTRPHPGRAYIAGLGFAKFNIEEGGNVIDINSVRPEKAGEGDVEKRP